MGPAGAPAACWAEARTPHPRPQIENDGYGPNSAIQNLVDALNAVAGAGTYAFREARRRRRSLTNKQPAARLAVAKLSA